MDPACGSGHILVYAFDLLFAIYQEQGYPEPSIPALILEHNLRGLDIDERAAQLTSFALMMKAREKSRRILRNPPALHVAHTVPTRGFALPEVPELKREDWEPLLDAFRDADNLGSLITPPELDLDGLEAQLTAFEASGRQEVSVDAPRLRALLKQAALLSRQYRAVVANPPYMGGSSFNKTVKDFVLKNYPRSKSDLFACFIDRCTSLVDRNGHIAMITQMAWMFLSSYESLRKHLLDNYTITTMAHMGMGAFGADFGTTAFSIKASSSKSDFSAVYVSLREVRDVIEKERLFLSGKNRYIRSHQRDFEKIPGSPIAYWVSERVIGTFEETRPLSDCATAKQGLATGNNDKFLKYWYEVNHSRIVFSATSRELAKKINAQWVPYSKGGEFRKWYGSHQHVVLWSQDAYAIRKYRDKNGNELSRFRAADFYFKEAITWGLVTSSSFSARYREHGYVFDIGGMSAFSEQYHYALGMLNSSYAATALEILNPTLNYQIGDIKRVPFKVGSVSSDIKSIIERCIELSKDDWNGSETSWDFQTHPLLRTPHPRLQDAFLEWQETAAAAFSELKRLEEENNRYWIDAYGLEDELTPEVPDAQITIRRADVVRDVKSLLSFAVGCMMGRYSLHQPGLSTSRLRIRH